MYIWQILELYYTSLLYLMPLVAINAYLIAQFRIIYLAITNDKIRKTNIVYQDCLENYVLLDN